MEIFALNLTEGIDRPIFNELMLYLAHDKQDKIRRFRYEKDAERSLAAELLIRAIICSKLKLKNSGIIFLKNSFGKPYLMDYDNFYFNISHSGNWVVCAVDDFEVGIDIEEIKDIDMDIAKRFFNENEYYDLMNKVDKDRKAYFYDLWTLKESYIKNCGKGLSIPLSSFSLSVNNDSINFKTDAEDKNYYFKQYYIDEGYKMAVCAKHENFPKDINLVTIGEIIEKLVRW